MSTNQHEFYRALASWWPLISPVEDYADEAAYVSSLLQAAPTTIVSVIELGSGGGHLAHHLVGRFALTLTDLSPDMLERSRDLNPGCPHHLGDMRNLRLDQRFDAVIVHDAIDYMTTEDDLRAVFATAHNHLEPGGTLLLMPDHTGEAFEPGTDVSGGDGDDGRAARLFEWTWDPDPTDFWAQTEYVFMLRAADGTITTSTETHRHGLFPEATWLRLLDEGGFDAAPVVEETEEDRAPRTFFIARRRDGTGTRSSGE